MLRRSVPLCFVLLLALQFIGVSGASATEEVARLHLSSGSIEWMPQFAAEEFILRLAGPAGAVRSWRFPGGSIPSLSLFNTVGQPLPDGPYTYELRATPRLSPGLREGLQAARDAGDEAAVQRLQQEIRGPLVQSGTFQIAGGALVTREVGEAEAGPPLKDQMVPDDLIVDGKGCIGLGCVNGEGFGAEALRLKQSVVRLRFEDTSSSAGFPTRDWQVTVNDPGSGGGDRFSIEDLTAGRTPLTILGNAPDNALVINSAGKVGLRTATPTQDIHIASGNTPALRLEQTTQGGLTAQTWDVAGSEANFFVRDVTGGSLLPFRIRPGAPTSSIDIASNGNVGIGTASPMVKLHLFESADTQTVIRVENTSSGANAGGTFRAQSDTTVVHFRAHGSGRTLSRFGVVLGGWSEIVQDIGNGLAIGTQNSTPIILGTNNTNRLHIAPDGKVGIGTASPEVKLHVFGATNEDTVVALGNDADGTPGSAFNIGFGGASFAGDAFLNAKSTASGNRPSIRFLTNTVDRMILTNTGSVGIGTTAPSDRLHVSGGNIRVSGGSFIDDGITLNAPDYVFDPSYSLMPIEQLRDFVARERRLPNVPSAGEIKEHGLNLSQLQLKLLEKVEELTLYAIGQQDQIKAQQELIRKLEERLARLEGKQ